MSYPLCLKCPSQRPSQAPTTVSHQGSGLMCQVQGRATLPTDVHRALRHHGASLLLDPSLPAIWDQDVNADLKDSGNSALTHSTIDSITSSEPVTPTWALANVLPAQPYLYSTHGLLQQRTAESKRPQVLGALSHTGTVLSSYSPTVR